MMGKPDEEFDPYAPSTGGDFDNFTAEVTEAVFRFDSQYGNGEIPVFAVTLHDATGENGWNENEKIQLLSIGTNWEIGPKGQTVTKVEGKGKPVFNNQSAIWSWFGSLLEHGYGDVLRGRGNPTDAKTLVGLTLRFEAQEYNAARRGEEDKIKSRPVPVEIVSEGKASKGVKASGEKADKPAAGGDLIPPALEKKLLKLAMKHEGDHEAFFDAANEIPEVDENVKIQSALTKTGKGSWWAMAMAELSE